MQSLRSVLFLTKRESPLNNMLFDLAYKRDFLVTTVYNLSDMIESVDSFKFTFLIIDSYYYNVNEDFLSLFQRQHYFVPFLIILSTRKKEFTLNSVFSCRRNIDDIEKIIVDCSAHYRCEYSLAQHTFSHAKIAKELNRLGMNIKYKGFKYLSDIIYFSRINPDLSKSYKSVLYPFLSSIYKVSTCSIERDVRNLINIYVKKRNLLEKICITDENYRPTTRNVICSLCCYLDDKI